MRTAIGPEIVHDARFRVGRTVATPGALDALEHEQLVDALKRHVRLEQGALGDEDQATNERAVKHGGRILSSFRYDGERVWVITEADRSVTTVLLPSEY